MNGYGVICDYKTWDKREPQKSFIRGRGGIKLKRKRIPFGLEGAGGLSLPLFTEEGELDEEENRRYAEWLVDQGCNTIVPGSLGLSLTDEERHRLWEIYADTVKDEMAVMPYLGYREKTIREFVRQIKIVEEIGVNSLYFCVRAPYEAAREVKFPDGSLWPGTEWPEEYEEEVYQYLKAGFEVTDLPVVIYNNVMPNTAGTIPTDFLVRLAQDFDNFSGLKTNSSCAGFEPYNLFPYEVEAMKSFDIPVAKGFSENEFVQALMYGCSGFIAPVTGHVFPDKLNEMCDVFHAGNIEKAFEIQNNFCELVKIHRENEFGTKAYLMEAIGFDTGRGRRPSFPLREGQRKRIDEILKEWGLYKKYTNY